MARGAQKQAQEAFNESKQNFNNSQSVYQGANANAGALYKQLMPQLTQEATNPQGFAPGDLAAMRTAGEQSLGGATAGAVGEGDLTAARLRNAGAFTGAQDESVRNAQRELSQRSVETEGQNALLKEQQRQSGIAGLGNLYGTNTQSMLGALGLGNGATNAGSEATNALTNAGNSGWFQQMLGLINAVKPTGSAGGGQSASFGFGG